MDSSCKFPVVYVCQNVWQLVNSRKNYCSNERVTFWKPQCKYSNITFHVNSSINTGHTTTSFYSVVSTCMLSNIFVVILDFLWPIHFQSLALYMPCVQHGIFIPMFCHFLFHSSIISSRVSIMTSSLHFWLFQVMTSFSTVLQ